MPEIMTPAQVAVFLGVDTATIYRLIRSKRLVARKAGRGYCIPRDDLDNYLLANSTRPDVREVLFDRLEELGGAHPGLNGDDLLAELERADDERKLQARSG